VRFAPARFARSNRVTPPANLHQAEPQWWPTLIGVGGLALVALVALAFDRHYQRESQLTARPAGALAAVVAHCATWRFRNGDNGQHEAGPGVVRGQRP
jgi:hypothetical protein